MKKLSIDISIKDEIYTEFRFEDYLLQLKIQGLAYESQRYYISYIKNFIEYAGFESINDFNNIIKLRFSYYKLTDKGITNNTIGKYYKCIRKYFYFLKEIEVSDKILIDDLPNVKTTRSLPKSLSEEEVYSIREVIKKNYRKSNEIKAYIIFETFINTGIRRSELANLKIEDINKTFIKINKGKGNKDRIIYISKTFSKVIFDYINLLPKKKREGSLSLFNLSVTGVSLIIRKLSRLSKIKFSPHLLRHTYATLCIQKGINVHTLQNMLGHSSLKTTAVYLSLGSKESYEEMQKLQF